MHSNPILAYRPLSNFAYSQVLNSQTHFAQMYLPQRMQLLNRIKQELMHYTGRDFFTTVHPEMRTSADDRQIFINLADLGGNDGSVVFWLAHEWGHLIHQDAWHRSHVSASIKEEQADIFAATFMRQKGYAIEGILDVLRVMPPPSNPNDEHGQTDVRMKNIYNAYLGNPLTYPPEHAQPQPNAALLAPKITQPQLFSSNQKIPPVTQQRPIFSQTFGNKVAC